MVLNINLYICQMQTQEKIILVTNDDGITAPGIAQLVEVAKQYGKVYVVAPDKPQSGMGHAVTIHTPIRLIRNTQYDVAGSYQCSGTPVDCVKIAVDQVLERKPDLCISGINHGANHSVNVLYSGTMSAAMEGALENIPSAGFSLMDFSWDADFSVAREVAEEVVAYMISTDLPDHTLFNVNIPKCSKEDFKGIQAAHQGRAKWEENFVHRTDPSGKDYYWLKGGFETNDHDNESDINLLADNFASLVPIQFDLTNYTLLKNLKEQKQFDAAKM